MSATPEPASAGGSARGTFDWHRHMNARERGLIDHAPSVLPGGCLGGNQLAPDIRFVFREGHGARFTDVSGNEYIDYCLGSGALVLGHAHASVTKAVSEQIGRGAHFFAYLNEPAIKLADKIAQHGPCVDLVRFTTCGSEATFHAMRLSRAFTGRTKILKFEGAYHGNHDYAQISITPKRVENYPQGVPDTDGIPPLVREHVLVAPYNDGAAVREIVSQHRDEVAAIIVEPIQRIISPRPEFLQELRETADRFGAVLIFDEVVTGFRYALGGAQEYFGVKPDLATYGKIIGGSLPVGAVGGRADIMKLCDPTNKGQPGYVYQNGTLYGNPLGCAAGLAAIETLEQPGSYDLLFKLGEQVRKGLADILKRRGIDAVVFGDGPMWHMLFADKPPTNHRDVMKSDGQKLAKFDTELIRHGIFVLPATRRFVSSAHTDADIEETFVRFDAACRTFSA